MACVPSHTRCDLRRVSSFSSTRIHCARSGISTQQLLDRQAVGQVVGHRAEIVDAVGQRDHLLVELRLAGLLDAGVQVADVGHQLDDGLAVDLQHQAQHAVSRRVLRAHVEHHGVLARAALPWRVASAMTSSTPGVIFWCGDGCHLRFLSLPRTSNLEPRTVLLAVAFHRIILAQGMALPVFRHHDAARAGMAGKGRRRGPTLRARRNLRRARRGDEERWRSAESSRTRSRTRSFRPCETMWYVS